MNRRALFLALFAAVPALGITGCSSDESALAPAEASTDPVVFSDDFGEGATYEAFLGTNTDAVQIEDDTNHIYQGTASLRITVPEPATGLFAGGAFTTNIVRNLSGYDALVFWAKASMTASLDVAGIANDNTGESLYEASTQALALTTTWQQYVIPIPLPEKLDLEGGLFFFAEGAENGMGYTIWLDEIRYEATGIVSDPRPAMDTGTLGSFVGASLEVTGTRTTLDVGGTDVVMNHLPGYFTFASSDEAVATAQGGRIQVVGGGSADITAKLGDIDVPGAITLEVEVPPTDLPPDPTLPPADVISLLTSVYPNVTVDKWSADFDQASLTELQIEGQEVKAYTFQAPFYYAAIEFIEETIDASAMTHLHLDVWVPDGQVFLVKLVDFGPDGEYNGGDDSEDDITFNAMTDPAIVTGQWIGLEIPLADLTGLDSTEHLAQLILQRYELVTTTAYVTNIYFHR
jgi:hypothetical protein